MSEQTPTDPSGLTPELLAALRLRDLAEQTAAAVTRATSVAVEAGWTRCDAQARRGNDPAYGLGYWATYPTAAGGGAGDSPFDDTWFEWGFFPATDDSPWDDWALLAGVTVGDTGGPLGRDGNAGWIAARRAEGFVEISIDSFDRLFRHLPLDEVVEVASLDGQSRELGSWILGVFEGLAADPPPQ